MKGKCGRGSADCSHCSRPLRDIGEGEKSAVGERLFYLIFYFPSLYPQTATTLTTTPETRVLLGFSCSRNATSGSTGAAIFSLPNGVPRQTSRETQPIRPPWERTRDPL